MPALASPSHLARPDGPVLAPAGSHAAARSLIEPCRTASEHLDGDLIVVGDFKEVRKNETVAVRHPPKLADELEAVADVLRELPGAIADVASFHFWHGTAIEVECAVPEYAAGEGVSAKGDLFALERFIDVIRHNLSPVLVGADRVTDAGAESIRLGKGRSAPALNTPALNWGAA